MSLLRLTSSIKSSTWTRLFATSAQKRKWKREAVKKPPQRIRETDVTELATPLRKDNTGGLLRAFLFLGVMPLCMSALVLWVRGDLIEDVQRFEPIRKEFKAAREKESDAIVEAGNDANRQ